MKPNSRPVPAAASVPPRDEASLGQSSSSPQRQNTGPTRLHLVVGPVGAGKSTFATQLAQGRRAVRLTLDEWMATLFRPDRPEVGVVDWYVERSARCIDQIWALTTQSLSVGIDVILEIGLLRRHEREAFYRRVDDAGFDLTIYVLDAPRDIRRERVNRRNHSEGPTFSMIVPPDIFEYASDLWEPADAAECAGRNVSFIRTDA